MGRAERSAQIAATSPGKSPLASVKTVRWLLRWSFPLLAAAIALWWAVLGVISAPAEFIVFIDWSTYAMGTERLLAGESLYLPIQLAGPYHLPDVTPDGYIYPPPSALLFLPFAVPEAGRAAWLVANVGLLFAGLAAVVRQELGSLRPIALGLAFLGLVLVVPLPGGQLAAPFRSGVFSANVNVGLAGLLALTWATGTRRGWIPYVAGVGAAFKIFPAALALWAARRHGWRSLVIAGAVVAGIVAVALPLTGLEEWRRFGDALSNAQPTCDPGRISVACLVEPVVGGASAKVAGVVAAGLLLMAAMVVRREFPAFVLLTAGMLAALADGHDHYLLFGYVLLVIGVCRWAARRGRGPLRAGLHEGPPAPDR